MNDRKRQTLSATRLFLNFWAANVQVPTTFAYPGSSLSLVQLPLRTSRLVAYPWTRIRVSSRCYGNKCTFVWFPRWINVCWLRVVTGIVALRWRHLDTFTPTRVFYTTTIMSKRLHYRKLLLYDAHYLYRYDRFKTTKEPSHWLFPALLLCTPLNVMSSAEIEVKYERWKFGWYFKRKIHICIVYHEVTRFQHTRVGWKRYAGRCRGRIPTDLFGRLIKRLEAALSRWTRRIRTKKVAGRGSSGESQSRAGENRARGNGGIVCRWRSWGGGGRYGGDGTSGDGVKR